MGREATHALTAQHPPTPPISDPSFDPHQIGESSGFDFQQVPASLPVSMAHEGYIGSQYEPTHYPESHHAIGLGLQYDFDPSPQGYYAIHRSHTGSPFVQSAMGMSSPPTPMSHHSDTIRTRSGRSIVRNGSPHSSVNRSSPSRTPRKKKSGAHEKHRTPKLTAPLSVLTKDMVDVPVRDMEAWVNRPTSERIKEAEKRNGYITRPMNSFMLYRSAYAERTKMWCLHNNHQVVSSVSGESWPLEPPKVREFYNDLAKMERLNHQAAHPNYKFSPSKPGMSAVGKKRNRADTDNESEPSDLDDPDWAAANGVRNRPAKRVGRDASYPARADLNDSQHHFHEVYDHNATWDQTVPQSVRATMQNQTMMHPQHFYPSPTLQQNGLQMIPHQQDPFNSFDSSSFPTNQSLIGLPGGSHTDLLGLNCGVPTPTVEHQVDPLLLAFEHAHHQDSGLAMMNGLNLAHHVEYAPSFEHQLLEHTSVVPYPAANVGGPLITDDRPREWHPDSQSPALAQASEFDKLWDEHQHNQSLERKASLKSHMEENPRIIEMDEPIQAPQES